MRSPAAATSAGSAVFCAAVAPAAATSASSAVSCAAVSPAAAATAAGGFSSAGCAACLFFFCFKEIDSFGV